MRCLAYFAVLCAASPAFALKQARHQQISHDSCTAAGLPDEFCERVGAAAYDVDANEWNDLTAHAQTVVGQESCEAANGAALRLDALGAEVRGALASSGESDAMADALGRALHTLQDECAHQGMTNPQHAWWSLEDSCSGTHDSPDVQPAAIRCAQSRTDEVFAAVRSAMIEFSTGPDALSSSSDESTHWPSRGDICHFLKTDSQSWSGYETRWNSAIVGPALTQRFERALTMDGVGGEDVCANGSIALPQRLLASTSGGESVCVLIGAYCLGKADGVDEAPPWENEPDMAPAQEAAGCAVGGRDAGAGGWILLLVVVAVYSRRSSTGGSN